MIRREFFLKTTKKSSCITRALSIVAEKEGVSEGVNLLFNQIRTNPGKRAPFLVNELLVPVKIVERWLKILRDDHKIEFRGAPKSGGYWLK